ncbi:DUF4136 domain-containing protein [Flexithrix dorotheae]|uniref:DUF4136 domain-containing protein n=1 Tax=Flexithrix dorotheae TaxID=70993 RepID=UPI0003A26610|nr:DUF4136 domain-containing protein [Flexithrix dorotheae]
MNLGKDFSFVILLLIAAVYSGCTSSINTSYDYDRDAAFEHYETFKVYSPTSEEMENMGVVMPQRLALLESSIASEMKSRAYVESNTPDLAITYFVSSQTKEKTSSTYVGVGGGSYGGYGGMSYGFGTSIPNTSYYQEGTLDVHIVDTQKSLLVWRGTAIGTFKEGRTDVEKLIESAVKQIFYKYRFKAGEGLKRKK